MQAVRLVENSVVWIPYGWVTMLVNNSGQEVIPNTLVAPYFNAKLILGYPGCGLLINFTLDHVKANDGSGKYWKEHGESYAEWLGTLHRQEDSQLAPVPASPPHSSFQESSQVIPPGPPALMDGTAEDMEQTDAEETQGGAAPENDSQI